MHCLVNIGKSSWFQGLFVISRAFIRHFKGQIFVVSGAIIRGFKGKHNVFLVFYGLILILRGVRGFRGHFTSVLMGFLTIYDFVVSGANLRGFRGLHFVVSGVKSSWFQGLLPDFFIL